MRCGVGPDVVAGTRLSSAAQQQNCDGALHTCRKYTILSSSRPFCRRSVGVGSRKECADPEDELQDDDVECGTRSSSSASFSSSFSDEFPLSVGTALSTTAPDSCACACPSFPPSHMQLHAIRCYTEMQQLRPVGAFALKKSPRKPPALVVTGHMSGHRTRPSGTESARCCGELEVCGAVTIRCPEREVDAELSLRTRFFFQNRTGQTGHYRLNVV